MILYKDDTKICIKEYAVSYFLAAFFEHGLINNCTSAILHTGNRVSEFLFIVLILCDLENIFFKILPNVSRFLTDTKNEGLNGKSERSFPPNRYEEWGNKI